jgi:hypothetical protein
LALAVLALVSCTEVRTYGEAAAAQRRIMNDLQAQGAVDLICDLSLGSLSRMPEPTQDWLSRNPACPLPSQRLIMLQAVEP